MNTSQRAIIDQIKVRLESCRSDIEQVQADEHTAYDNLPENLQNGSAEDKHNDIIQALDESITSLQDSIDKLVENTRMTKLGFGKHGDDDIENVPEDYLKWLMNNSQEKVDICKSELERRASKFDGTFMMRIVKSGFSETSKGLSPDETRLCERARDALIKAITSAAGSTQP